ncbi:MAG TPA: PEP-CTERM sorting domain-containing protein [Verrucomicrobiae bacterium]|nr:PEP-CTERM sorting domain-containing protein [Verrucomicrobiae bacterium]
MKKNNKAVSVLFRMYRGGMIGGLGLISAAFAISGNAQMLSVPNSSVSIGTTSGGVFTWNLNGVQQMDEQTFFYSVGSGTLNSISSISSGTTTSQTTSSLTEKYANSTLGLTTGYSLGQSAFGANLSTSISLQNLSGISQTFHFYQFSYFDLGGSFSGQNVQFLETTVPYEVVQTGGGGGMTGTISALAGGGLASVEEVAGVYNGSNFGLASGNPAPTFTDSPLSASGNVDFAYEISATLAANSSITISELQSVPEPSTVALISSGLIGVGLLRWRGLAVLKK